MSEQKNVEQSELSNKDLDIVAGGGGPTFVEPVVDPSKISFNGSRSNIKGNNVPPPPPGAAGLG